MESGDDDGAGASTAVNNVHLLTRPLATAGAVLQRRWRLTGALPVVSGTGQLWAATDVRTRQRVVVKLEPARSAVKALAAEIGCLRAVADCAHVVPLLGTGAVADALFVVLPYAGRSLKQLQAECGGRFGAATALRLLALQTAAVRALHERGWLHRDLSPGNFLVGDDGAGRRRRVRLIDFSMARQWRDARGEHRPRRPDSGFHGTPAYAPLAAHAYADNCRADDLESLLYMAAEALLGADALPWATAEPHARLPWVGATKAARMPACVARWPAVVRAHALVHAVGFYDRPPYEAIVAVVDDAVRALGVAADAPFDWETA